MARRKLDPERLLRDVLAARERIADEVRDMDPGDVLLILQSMLRPMGTGKIFFLRRAGPNRHVF